MSEPAFLKQTLLDRKIAFTRYTWRERPALGWAISDGVSRFLIAEGSGYSRNVGRRLYRQLVDEHHKHPATLKRRRDE